MQPKILLITLMGLAAAHYNMYDDDDQFELTRRHEAYLEAREAYYDQLAVRDAVDASIHDNIDALLFRRAKVAAPCAACGTKLTGRSEDKVKCTTCARAGRPSELKFNSATSKWVPAGDTGRRGSSSSSGRTG